MAKLSKRKREDVEKKKKRGEDKLSERKGKEKKEIEKKRDVCPLEIEPGSQERKSESALKMYHLSDNMS
jgi:hypothetical protein